VSDQAERELLRTWAHDAETVAKSHDRSLTERASFAAEALRRFAKRMRTEADRELDPLELAEDDALRLARALAHERRDEVLQLEALIEQCCELVNVRNYELLPGAIMKLRDTPPPGTPAQPLPPLLTPARAETVEKVELDLAALTARVGELEIWAEHVEGWHPGAAAAADEPTAAEPPPDVRPFVPARDPGVCRHCGFDFGEHSADDDACPGRAGTIYLE